MALKRKRYDDKFRAAAVVTLEAQGYPDKPGALTVASKYLGVPHPTLSRWYNAQRNPPPNDLVQEKRADLADLFENAARVYLQHAIHPDVVDEVPGQSAMTAAAIATDKMQLLRGLPTAIVSLMPQLVKALEAAGYDPVQVFNDLIAEAATRQQELSQADAEQAGSAAD